MAKIQRVLISVTDKTGIVEFARELRDLGAELISTGGTARLLRESGVPVRDVSEVTGFPEMLDGRVKTMHPNVAGGILAMRGKPEHMQALAAHGIAPIDMVVVNLYRFEEVAAKADASPRRADREHRYRRPHHDPRRRQELSGCGRGGLARRLRGHRSTSCGAGGALSPATSWRLAQKAFRTTADYDRRHQRAPGTGRWRRPRCRAVSRCSARRAS